MRKEGRQQGMVRAYQIFPTPLNHHIRTTNVVESTPTAGIFEKVESWKPTNHSKSRVTLKMSANDDVSRMTLLTWRVVDGKLGLGMSLGKSSSALEIMKRLEERDGVVEDEMEMDGGDEIGIEEVERMDSNSNDENEDETMSFCEVGYVWEQVEGDDDSWCLVAEM